MALVSCLSHLLSIMHAIYSIRDGVRKEITPGAAVGAEAIWVNLNTPSEEDLAAVKSLIDLPFEVIAEVKDVNEVPKLDRVDEYLYLLLQTPIAAPHADPDHPSDLDYATAPLAILLNDRMIVTVSWGNNDVIAYLEKKLKNIANNLIVDTGQHHQMALKFFLFTAKLYLRYLKDIYNRLQVPLFDHKIPTFDKDIIDLLKIEQSLVYFDTSLRSNYIVIEKISHRKQFVESEEGKELLDDVLNESRQAMEVVKVYSHIVEDVRGALSSLISNNLTRTVNWLTKVTVLLMIPTFVASVYGMNVPLPFAHSRYAFWIVVSISVGATAFGVWWLRAGERQSSAPTLKEKVSS